MSRSEVWAQVFTERRQLADDLAALPRTAWETPSLCPGWTIHDVLAHLIDTARTGKLAFVLGMIRARGDFDRANAEGVRRYKSTDPRHTLTEFRAVHALTKSPPTNRATRLVEAFVHGEDIRRPLGIAASYPGAGVREALAYQLRTPASFGGGRELAAGLKLRDTGSGVSWGAGPEVAGAAIDLPLAVSGRPVEAGLLTGPGSARLLRTDGSGDGAG